MCFHGVSLPYGLFLVWWWCGGLLLVHVIVYVVSSSLIVYPVKLYFGISLKIVSCNTFLLLMKNVLYMS